MYTHCCIRKAASITNSGCVCVCSIKYPARNLRASYCYVWSPWLYYIRVFPIFSHKLHDLKKTKKNKNKILNIKCVFISSTSFFSEIFLILRRNEQYVIINVRRSSCKVGSYSCQILMKIEFSRQIFEIYSNIKLHENPFSGSRLGPCRRTDRRDVANSRFSQFCERA